METRNLLGKLGAWTVRRSKVVLVVSLLLTLLAGFGASRLGIDTDISNMLPRDNATAQAYTRVSEAFDSTAALIVVAQGPDRDTLLASARKLAAEIEGSKGVAPLVREVDWRMNREFAEKWGLMVQDPGELSDTARIFSAIDATAMLGAANDVIEEKLSDGSDDEVSGPDGERDTAALMSRFALFSREFGRAFLAVDLNGATPGIDRVDGSFTRAIAGMADAWLYGDEYMIDPEEKTLLMIVRPSFDIGDRAKLRLLSDGMSALARKVETEVTGISFGFTGDAESEASEERAMSADVVYPSLVAVAIIAVLFLFSFRRLRSIAMALVAMCVGILWDIGLAALTVGELNMITGSFGALLVGLGIDFGIHIASRFDEEVESGHSTPEAVSRVFASVGVPILIGGLTTAAAFYMLLLSDTPAFREFALVSGTGILTTLLASFVLLPALLAVTAGKAALPAASGKPKRPLTGFGFARDCALLCVRKRAAALTLSAVAAVALGANAWRNSFEFDMRKIGPQGTEAQRFEKAVEKRFGISTWQHMAMADSREAAEELVRVYEGAPFVRYAESISDYVPSAAEQERRLESIGALRRRLAETAARGRDFAPADVDAILYELERLEWNVIELGDLAATSIGEDSLPVRKRTAIVREIFGSATGAVGEEVFARLREVIASVPSGEAAARLSAVDRAFSAAVALQYGRLVSLDSPLGLEDLPASIRSEFVSPDGSGYLVRIVPTAGLSGDEAFGVFADGLKAAAPGATGTLVLGVELSRSVLAEASRIAILVAVVVFGLVGLGFRSARLTLAAFAAFAAAMLWTFGLSPFFGKFNIVSALALPIIFGIGVDYCVHMVSALRSGEKPGEAVGKTTRAMTLSMLTTLIGFGSLALVGTFKGIADLGTVLSLGIVASFAAAIIVIPALLGPPKIGEKGESDEHSC